MLLKEQAASKTVYTEDGGTSCLQNHGTYLLGHNTTMLSHHHENLKSIYQTM